jgi:glutamate-1-semialdehyde 2,1-aminomutase
MARFDRERSEPEHFVPQVGTLPGNPIAAAAGLATLEILRRPGAYDQLFETGRMLMSALSERLTGAGLEAQVVGEPPMFDVVFASGDISSYRDTLRADTTRMASSTRCYRRGASSRAGLSTTSRHHSRRPTQHTLDAWDDALSALTA